MRQFEEISDMLDKLVGGQNSLFNIGIDPLSLEDCKQTCETLGCSPTTVGEKKGEVKGKEYPTPPPGGEIVIVKPKFPYLFLIL